MKQSAGAHCVEDTAGMGVYPKQALHGLVWLREWTHSELQ